jgi:hypothetical protein
MAGLTLRRFGIVIGAGAALVVLLVSGIGDAGRVGATGDGEFTANATVILGSEEIECVISGELQGESHAVEGTEAWDVTDTLVNTSGRCPFGKPDTEEDDLVQEVIEGTVSGRVTEDEPNGNGLADGMAAGEFEINLSLVQSSTLGDLSTDEPALLTCPEINLDLSPTTYTCTLVQEVQLYGAQGQATIAKMEVTFTGEPNYFDQRGTPIDPQSETPEIKEPPVGSGPAETSGEPYALLIVLLALGGGMSLAAGVLAVRRR